MSIVSRSQQAGLGRPCLLWGKQVGRHGPRELPAGRRSWAARARGAHLRRAGTPRAEVGLTARQSGPAAFGVTGEREAWGSSRPCVGGRGQGPAGQTLA